MRLFAYFFFSSALIIMLTTKTGFTQNIGIGTTAPLQKLDVNGAIKIGTTPTNHPGSIRFNTGKFEGGDGTNWKSFEGLPSKAIILARSIDTAELRLVGFNVFKASDIQDHIEVSVPTNFPGQWEFSGLAGNEPQDIYNLESVLYNNKIIYYNADGILYQYDITTAQWSQLPGTSSLSLRAYFSMTLAGNEIYIFGGNIFTPLTVYTDGAKYNLTTNTWSAVANMPVGSFIHSSCALGNEIFIIGGSSNISSGIELEKKIYKYNTLTNTWSSDLSNANTPYSIQGNALVRNNKILLVRDSITEYDPVINSYTKLADIVPTALSTTSTLVQDSIYVFGGIRQSLPPPLVGEPIMLHYRVNLLNGQSTSLNTACNQQFNVSYYTYKYVSGLNKNFLKYGTSISGIFDPSGSFPCNIDASYNSFLYYLQKQ